MKKRISLLLFVTLILGILYVPNPRIAKASERFDVTLATGMSTTLTSSMSGKVTWITTDKTVATVSSKGKVTAKGGGVAIIYAQKGKKYEAWWVKVIGNEENVYYNDISQPKGLNCKKKTLVKGGSFELYLNGIEAHKVTWKSSNSKVCSVKGNGVTAYAIAGKKAGSATITAKIGKKTYKCKVKVTSKLLSSNTTSLTVKVDHTKKATITLKGTESDEIFCEMDLRESMNPMSADVKFGKWDGNKIPLIVKGVEPGESIWIVSNKLTGEQIPIKITVKK